MYDEDTGLIVLLSVGDVFAKVCLFIFSIMVGAFNTLDFFTFVSTAGNYGFYAFLYMIVLLLVFLGLWYVDKMRSILKNFLVCDIVITVIYLQLVFFFQNQVTNSAIQWLMLYWFIGAVLAPVKSENLLLKRIFQVVGFIGIIFSIILNYALPFAGAYFSTSAHVSALSSLYGSAREKF